MKGVIFYNNESLNMTLDDGNYYFFYDSDGMLYVGNGSNLLQNGVVNKNIVNAFLPTKYNNIQVYGVGYRALSALPNLVSIFVPRTYKVIWSDFFKESPKVVSVEFEENSQLKTIGHYMALRSGISSFTYPSSIKNLLLFHSFKGCKNLKTIYYKGMAEPQFDNMTFSGVPDDLVIYVRRDYPYKTFAGRQTTPILNPKYRGTCFIRRKQTCSSFNLMFLVVMIQENYKNSNILFV